MLVSSAAQVCSCVGCYQSQAQLQDRSWCDDVTENNIHLHQAKHTEEKVVTDSVIQRTVYFGHAENLMLEMVVDEQSHMKKLGPRQTLKVCQQPKVACRGRLMPRAKLSRVKISLNLKDLKNKKHCTDRNTLILRICWAYSLSLLAQFSYNLYSTYHYFTYHFDAPISECLGPAPPPCTPQEPNKHY